MAGRIDRMPLHGAARPWRGQLLHARARVVGEEEEWGRRGGAVAIASGSGHSGGGRRVRASSGFHLSS